MLAESEFEVWLGIMIYMSVLKLPSIQHYWSTFKDFATGFMQESGMSRNRWTAIREALHFVDESDAQTDSVTGDNNLNLRYVDLHGASDPLRKVRPVLEIFRQRCISVIKPDVNYVLMSLPSRRITVLHHTKSIAVFTSTQELASRSGPYLRLTDI